MMDFIEQDPIDDESDIPTFVSNDDLLNRYLSDLKDISSIAIYKTDGTCIQRKDRSTIKHS